MLLAAGLRGAGGFALKASALYQHITDSNGVVISFGNDQRLGLDVGAMAAAGVRLHLGRLAVLPDFRYTRWGSGNNLIRQNDVRFQLGLTL